MGRRDTEAQACVQCSTAGVPWDPPTRLPLRGAAGDGRAEPTPTRPACQPPDLPPPGTWRKSAENWRALPPAAPRTLPGSPRLHFSPQSGAVPTPAQGGRRSLTVQQGMRAQRAGSLLQAGPLEFPLSSAAPWGEVRWAVGWGGALS